MAEENVKPELMVVSIDGKEYDFNTLPDFVKQLVQTFHVWNTEYQNSKVETMKLEFALAGLSKQISSEVLKANGENSTIEIREKSK
jgi:hypothetical protein